MKMTMKRARELFEKDAFRLNEDQITMSRHGSELSYMSIEERVDTKLVKGILASGKPLVYVVRYYTGGLINHWRYACMPTLKEAVAFYNSRKPYSRQAFEADE